MDMHFRPAPIIILMALSTSCSLKPLPAADVKVRIAFDLSSESANLDGNAVTLPGGPGDFDCYAINVIGEGIPSLNGKTNGSLDSFFNGNHCTYPGATSALVKAGESGEMEVKIPVGSRRLVQVLGVKSNVGCPSDKPFGRIATELEGSGKKLSSQFPVLVELGRETTSVFKDTDVSITASFDPNHPKDLDDCDGRKSGRYPPNFSGLKIWLKADSLQVNDNSSVSTWYDSSDSGAHATCSGTCPTFKLNQIGGLPALDFNGSTQYMTADSIGSSFSGTNLPATMIVVAKPVNVAGTLLGFADVSSIYASLRIEMTAGPLVEFVKTDNSNAQFLLTGTNSSNSQIISISTTGTYGYLYLNGTNLSQNSLSLTGTTLSNFTIGTLRLAGNPASYYTGLIAEVIVYNTYIGDDARRKIECYLSEKYSISVSQSCN